MANAPKRPSFIDSWLTDLQEDYRRYGARKLVPWTAMICICIGAAIAALTPEEFWKEPEQSGLFLAAIVTINGLLLALSWGSFAKIYEIAARPKLASFLRRNDLLRDYIFHVDYIHAAQVFALCCSAMTLVLCFVKLPAPVGSIIALMTIQGFSFALSLASTIYALYYALGAVRIMQDLVWYSTYFVADGPELDLQVHEGGKGDRS